MVVDLQRANSLILAGSVLVNDQKITKANQLISINSKIEILEKIPKYVSRGAYKLLGALDKMNLTIQDRICIDLGASTGGFTQVLLEKKAAKVYAIDVGYGQLATKLANDPRVQVLDRFHAKNIHIGIFKEKPKDLLIVMDLSFISLTSIIPLIPLLKKQAIDLEIEVLNLIKPQFEYKGEHLVKGIIKNKNIHFQVIKKIAKLIKYKQNGQLLDFCESSIKGDKGNTEFFLRWKI